MLGEGGGRKVAGGGRGGAGRCGVLDSAPRTFCSKPFYFNFYKHLNGPILLTPF